MKQINSLCGSSETTRKTPFNFELFYKYGHAKHVPRISQSFLEWFIGFFEGDGTIYKAKTTYSKHRFSFRIVQKEKKIIYTLKETFGFGNISQEIRKSRVYWRWTVESKSGVEKIAYLLYGNLVLPARQKQYISWIQSGQQQLLFKQISLDRLKFVKNGISAQNAWLSGFIDAEGCFYAQFYEVKSNCFQLKQKMHLTQSIDGEQEQLLIFQQMLDLFQSKSKICVFKNSNEGKSYARVEFHSLKSQRLIIEYLALYKLKTQKYITYRRWWRVFLRRESKMHLTEKGRASLLRLVRNINNLNDLNG